MAVNKSELNEEEQTAWDAFSEKYPTVAEGKTTATGRRMLLQKQQKKGADSDAYFKGEEDRLMKAKRPTGYIDYADINDWVQQKVKNKEINQQTADSFKREWEQANEDAIASRKDPTSAYDALTKTYEFEKPSLKTMQDEEGRMFEVQTTPDTEKVYQQPATKFNEGASNRGARTTTGNYIEQNPENKVNKEQAKTMAPKMEETLKKEEPKKEEPKAPVEAPKAETKPTEAPKAEEKKPKDPYSVSLWDTIAAKLKGISNAFGILGHYSPMFSTEETTDPAKRLREKQLQGEEKKIESAKNVEAEAEAGKASVANYDDLMNKTQIDTARELYKYAKEKGLEADIAVSLQSRLADVDLAKQKALAEALSKVDVNKQRELMRVANMSERDQMNWMNDHQDLVREVQIARSGNRKEFKDIEGVTSAAGPLLGAIFGSDRRLKYAIRMN